MCKHHKSFPPISCFWSWCLSQQQSGPRIKVFITYFKLTKRKIVMGGLDLSGPQALYVLCFKDSSLLLSPLLVFLLLNSDWFNYLIYVEKIANLLGFLLMRKVFTRISEAYGLLSQKKSWNHKSLGLDIQAKVKYVFNVFHLLSEICIFIVRKRMTP